jgi:hypothetical protein
MKILVLSSIALVGLLLVSLQHEQIGQLRAENGTLQQAATEANQLKTDLARYAATQTQDAAGEIERLRAENRDLLRLRNAVNQLNDARVDYEKVSAENQRLQLAMKSLPKPPTNQNGIESIVIRINDLYDRGLSTPEAAVETFLWAERDGNADELSRCIVPEHARDIREADGGAAGQRQNFGNAVSVEIAARRDVDANTVQLGLQFHLGGEAARDTKFVVTLRLSGGEWRVDVTHI